MRNWIRGLWTNQKNRKSQAHRRPSVEALEDRCVPTITMTIKTFLLVEGRAPSPPVQVLTFTDSENATGNANDYSAKINWNDGSGLDQNAPVIALSSGKGGSTFAILGSHSFDHTGSYPVTILLHDSLDNTDRTGYSLADVQTENQHFVENVYQALLGRHADTVGLTAWTNELNQGVSRYSVVQQIEQNDEYLADIIGGLYGELLNRTADPSGMQTWTAYLHQGHSTEQLEAQILGSGEYFTRRGNDSNGGWLEAVYRDVLDRDLDAGGAQTWGVKMTRGFTRTSIAMSILGNAEAAQAEVQRIYGAFLQRPADSDGLAHFTSQMIHGGTREQIIASVLSSDEYFNNF